MLDQPFFFGFKEAFAELVESDFTNVDRILIPVLMELNRSKVVATIDSCAGHNDTRTRHHSLYIKCIAQNMGGELSIWGVFGTLNDIIERLPNSHPGHVFKGQPALQFKRALVSPTRRPEDARRVMVMSFSMKFRKDQIELKQVFLDLFLEAIKTMIIRGAPEVVLERT